MNVVWYLLYHEKKDLRKIIQELKMFVDELDQAYIMYSLLCIVWFVLEEWICLISVD